MPTIHWAPSDVSPRPFSLYTQHTTLPLSLKSSQNEGLQSSLQNRSNRITDSALFDAANSLAHNEILPSSPEVLGNLYDDTAVVSDVGHAGAKEKSFTSSAATKQLKEGWEERILRHHDKIIRAKNRHAQQQELQQQQSFASPTTTQRPPKTTHTSAAAAINREAHNHTAVPPPQLISALRQIFGSTSSSDLHDLIASSSGRNNTKGGDKTSETSVVNVLPLLLKAVLNHGAFTGVSSAATAGALQGGAAKRDLGSLFESSSDDIAKEEEDTKSEKEGDIENVACGKRGDSSKDDASPTFNSPSAANTEAIIGNVCRDMLKDTSDNTRIHGLLIAALSVLTGSLMTEEDLENLQPREAKESQLKSPGQQPSVDSLANTDNPKHFLQVGAALSLLKSLQGKIDIDASSEFLLNDQLLGYFAEASSTYEERIEIQKTNLFKTPVVDSAEIKAVSDIFTPKGRDGDSMVTPPPTLQNLVSDDHADDDDARTSDGGGLEDESDAAGEGLAEMLMREAEGELSANIASAIASIVAGESASFDEDDGASSDEYHEEEDSVIEEGYDEEEENATFQETSEGNARDSATATANNAGDERSESGHEEVDAVSNGEDEESIMLHRALALSLAATASAGASESSNSDSSSLARSSAANEPPSSRARKFKAKLERKESAESCETKPPSDNEESALLPPLPTPLSSSVLPSASLFARLTMQDHASITNDTSEVDVSAVFDPSSLSSYGNVPASHVLVHLLHSILGVLQTSVCGSDNFVSSTKATGDLLSTLMTPRTPASSAKKRDSAMKESVQMNVKESPKVFMPDSATVQLLTCSLILSNQLRSSAILTLSDILSNVKGKSENSTEEQDGIIQIADSAESEDPLFEQKDDPADGVTSESLENKGLKRKAAAAADVESLKHTTKQKMVEVWKERAAFYSVCCYLTMRCIRIVMGKCVQNGLSCSDANLGYSEYDTVIHLSTRARVGLSTAMSAFHSASTSTSFQALQESMSLFDSNDAQKLSKQLLVVPLCNESLQLWGSSIPLMYPVHNTRVELLHGALRDGMSSSTTEESIFSTVSGEINDSKWNDGEIQRFKLDILCRRLRMSDMLDCFVAQPMLGAGNDSGDTEDSNQLASSSSLPDNSHATVSLLGAVVEKYQQPSEVNLTKLYLALCQRTISNLILWNDLSLSPDDEHEANESLRLSLAPSKLHFDATKCSDSIALDSAGATANQRAAKVWGTVLSSTCFLPKSGVHRWAVRLDKCERGHVFVGVATARASTKTYVGGDGNGWGLIGTQALWHDRNKIRSDYGAMVRTGSVIVATLDTNVGTLSYGLWKDASPDGEGSGAAGAMSPSQIITSMTSPRRGIPNAGSAFIEDWGVAFEGIPSDVKLYPAVGLYQRDDRATLYTISSNTSEKGTSTIPPTISSGRVYFPAVNEANTEDTAHVRSWNQTLCSDGINFASEILARSVKLLELEQASTLINSSVLLTTVLPTLASSICLVPSCIPTLSARYAMELLPLVTRCAKLLDSLVLPENRSESLGVAIQEGTWILNADAATSSDGDNQGCVDIEEYTVNFKHYPGQDDERMHSRFYGGGKSTSGRKANSVSIIGSSQGTHVQFVEEWSDEESLEEGVSTFFDFAKRSTSSCVVDARLSLCGTKLVGTYHNVQQGTSGNISGYLQQAQFPSAIQSTSGQTELIQTESLLTLAVGHLSLVLCSHTALSDIDAETINTDVKKARDDIFLSLLLTSPILSSGRQDTDGSSIRKLIDSVWERCRSSDIRDYGGGSDIVEQWQDLIYFDLFVATNAASDENATKKDSIQRSVESHTSSTLYEGSFSRMCPVSYSKSHQKVASAILYHSNDITDSSIETACYASLRLIENGIREALGRAQSGVSLKYICAQRCSLTDSITDLIFDIVAQDGQSNDIIEDIANIYKSIQSEEDLDCLTQHLQTRTEKCIMRYVSLRSLQLLLGSEDSHQGITVCSAMESALISLPRLLLQFSTTTAGCSAGVQKCIVSSVKSLYSQIDTVLASLIEQQSAGLVSNASLVLALLANYFVTLHPSEKMIQDLRDIMGHCRSTALQSTIGSSPEAALAQTLDVHSAQRLLETTAFALQTTASILSQQMETPSSSLTGFLSDSLLNEVTEAIPIAEESYKLERREIAIVAIKSDWDSSQKRIGNTGVESDERSVRSAGFSFFSKHSTLQPTKSNASASSSESVSADWYLGQLLDTVHVCNGFMTSRQLEWANVLVSAVKSRLPLNCRLRILRFLRRILHKTEAQPELMNALFQLSGLVGCYSDNEIQDDSDDTVLSCDNLALSSGVVALLRYLYVFSSDGSRSWRSAIHETISDASNVPASTMRGILSFFGGSPSFLRNGSFVIIEPDVASSLSSSSSAAAGKSRVASSGATSSLNNSAGKGIEGVLSGLLRSSSQAGILSSVDTRSGLCEVMVMSNRTMMLQSTALDASSSSEVTVRAVHVNASGLAAADELPLMIESQVPAAHMFDSLRDQLKLSAEECPTSCDMLSSAMALRSGTVLLSLPVIHKQFSSGKSLNSLRSFLAIALQLASQKPSNDTSAGLNSLPSVEARLWHLLSVGVTLKVRKAKLEDTSILWAELLEQTSSKDKSKISKATSTGLVGYHTPPAVSGRSFFGSALDRAFGGSSSGITAGSNSASAREEEDDDTAAAHLREAAIVQMQELGLPRQWAELALRRTGGTIEAAVHFCLERGGDMERLLAEDLARGPSSMSFRRRGGFGASSRINTSTLINQLVEMGFPRHWCAAALAATSNNVDDALTWILTNGERLSAEDENAEDEQAGEESDEDDEDEGEEEEWDQEEDSDDGSKDSEKNILSNVAPDTTTKDPSNVKSENISPTGWSGSICPVRFVSGRSKIDPQTLDVAGLQDGGFSSVGTKGVLLTSGKWYYEAEIKTAGCLQIGWADSSFAGHCQADRGDGVGDGPSSWAFDGWRRYRWHSTATEWGCRWQEGDVVGCLVDMDSMSISFTLNGKGEEIGMGLAFSEEGFRPCSGVYACVSFNRREKIRLILGGEGTESFKYSPPEGYRGVGEAILDAVKQQDILLQEEECFLPSQLSDKVESLDGDSKKYSYICDFSDGEHGHEVFSWQHRYYGSDASVHLGGNRSALSGGASGKVKGGKSSNHDSISADISSRLRCLSEKSDSDQPKAETEEGSSGTSFTLLKESYDKIISSVNDELAEICKFLNVMYAKKLVMHVMVSYSDRFSPMLFLPKDLHMSSDVSPEVETSRKLFQVLEDCSSISGWLGEAGAMALAAEALGLGISTFDSTADSTPGGLCVANNSCVDVFIPCGGVSQCLSSAILPSQYTTEKGLISTTHTFAACSEAAVGCDSGGSLAFVRIGLQNAVATSSSFRQVLLAGIRRAVRLLAVTEYTLEDGLLNVSDA